MLHRIIVPFSTQIQKHFLFIAAYMCTWWYTTAITTTVLILNVKNIFCKSTSFRVDFPQAGNVGLLDAA